jgi:hypothetical protein
VTITMSRVEDDPLLQYVWLAMKDRPPLDLRRHHRLFARLNARYTHTPLHQLDDMLPIPVGRAYADALIAHFGSGPSADQLDMLGTAWLMVGELLGDREPLAMLRLRALVNLVLAVEEAQQVEWHKLATLATTMLDTAVASGDFTTYHRCLALPAFYLDDDEPTPHEQRLSIVEEHRSAGLRYWLTAAPPPAPADDRLAELQKKEADLLDQLRATRFVRLIPYLPGHYRRFTTDLRAMLRDNAGSATSPHPFDQQVAERRMTEIWDQLVALWRRTGRIDAHYARQRQNPLAELDEFTAGLTASALTTRPIGPSPIQRTSAWIAANSAADVAASAERPPQPPVPDASLPAPDQRAEDLGAQAASLVQQYHCTHDLGALNAAIRAEVEACRLLDQRSADHLRHLDHLSTIRAGRYLHSGDEADINTAIAGHETAVMRSRGPGIPADLRVALHFNAGMSYHHRYDRVGDLADLRRALEHWKAAAGVPGIDPQQALAARSTYADALRDLYSQTEQADIIGSIIAAQRAIIDVTDPHDRNLPGRLATLATDLLVQYDRTGAAAARDEAIDLMRKAVDLARGRDPRNLVPLLNNLAAALLVRHAEAHTPTDLDDAITALDEAAATAPIGPLRIQLLHSLADAVQRRYDRRGDPTDATRAARLRAQADQLANS